MSENGAATSRSAGVKRLLREAKELHKPTSMFYAKPLEDNLFEWHFTLRGPPDTEFEGGIYHGRIILPHEYPMKPPNVVLLTPNGRFETNTKICLSISGYHPETWLPSWSIRTAILALIGFFPTEGGGAVGAINCSADARKKLAKKSLEFHCETCGCTMKDVLPESDEEPSTNTSAGPSGDSTEKTKEETSNPEASTTTPSTSSTASPVQAPGTPSTSPVNANLVPTPISTSRQSQVQRVPSSTIPVSLYAFGICICFAAFVGLLARRISG